MSSEINCSDKTTAEMPACLSNLAFSNTVQNTNLAQKIALAQQEALNILQVATTYKTVTLLTRVTPEEVLANAILFKGSKSNLSKG